jgi:hypothetical protein
MTEQPLNYQTPQPGNPLKLPAIILLALGGTTLVAILLDYISRLTNGSINVTFGIHVGSPDSTMCFNAVSAVLLVIMMIGAFQMLRLRSYGMAMTAAILAIFPLTASCCCVLTGPVGLWALLLLLKPPVKAAFGR